MKKILLGLVILLFPIICSGDVGYDWFAKYFRFSNNKAIPRREVTFGESEHPIIIYAKGQTIQSVNIARIMTTGFADSFRFVTATDNDTGFFNLSLSYKKYGILQKIDSIMLTWWSNVNTDSMYKAYLDTVSTLGVAYPVDSFTTVLGYDTTETKIFSSHNILDKVYQLRLLVRGTGEWKASKIKPYISNQ